MAPDGTLGERLNQWLERLDQAGFAVGVRERLTVQQLLVQQAGAGLLKEPWPQLLGRLAPLLCANPRQQADYQRLLQQFEAEQAAAGATVLQPSAARYIWALLAAVLVIVGGGFAVHSGSPAPPACVENCGAGGAASAPAFVSSASVPAGAAQVFVAPGSLLLAPSRAEPAPWAGALAWGLRVAALLSLLALLLWVKRWRPPPMRLQQERTDAALDEHVLRTAQDAVLAPHPIQARAVAAALRQRVAGTAAVLDLAATLRATLRATGALSPRYRSLKLTPEYLVLMDQRQALDHAATYAFTLVRALRQSGVHLTVWCYEGSPDDGLWPVPADIDSASRTRTLPFAEVAARHAGHRLLVFGDCAAGAGSLSGQPRVWQQSLGLLSQRAWFTPLPLHAWAGAETAVEQTDFLLLPQQEGALSTLASWLSSEQLVLTVPADWPLAYPTALAGDGQEWVTRQTPPPPEALEDLLRQLQLSLGSTRWSWLCACAVFPGLSPALTLALGRVVLGDDGRALTLGYTALSALPWFREAFMPLWLRQSLVSALEPELKFRVRQALKARIEDAASQVESASNGPVLASVARERATASGASASTAARSARSARDVLLVRFMAEDERVDELAHTLDSPSFAERLGLRLRRFLAVPRWVWPSLATVATAGAATLTPWWPSFNRVVLQVPVPKIPGVLNEGNTSRAVGALAYSPDGTQLVGQLPRALLPGNAGLAADGQVWDARTGEVGGNTLLTQQPRAMQAARSPDEKFEAVITDGTLALHDEQGRVLGLPLGGPYAAVAFSPDGKRLAARSPDGSIHRWGVPYGLRVEWVGCANDEVMSSLGVQLSSTMQSAAQRAPAPSPAAPPLTPPRTEIDQVVYTGPAWSRLHRRSAPAPRLILHGADGQAQAEILRTFLSGNPGTADGRWQLELDPGITGRIVIGLCLSASAPAPSPAGLPVIEGLSARQVLDLQVRVSAMFSSDADRRIAATEALLKDPAVYSDAVALALRQALEFQSAGVSAGSPEMDGVYNVLVLASSAMPATLNREAAAVQRLVAAASANGPKTMSQARALLQRLEAGGKRRPLVYVQFSGEAQRPRAEALLPLLRDAGWDAPAVEDVGAARQPQHTQLRVQGLADRAVARRVAGLAGSSLRQVVNVVATPPRLTRPTLTDTYELWLGAEVDVQTAGDRTAQAASASDGPARDLELARARVTVLSCDTRDMSSAQRVVAELKSSKIVAAASALPWPAAWNQAAVAPTTANEVRHRADARAAASELASLLAGRGLGDFELRQGSMPSADDLAVLLCKPPSGIAGSPNTEGAARARTSANPEQNPERLSAEIDSQFPDATVGIRYSVRLVSGGRPPITIQDTSPLPPGLNIVGQTLAGVPTRAGRYRVEFVINETGNDEPVTISEMLVVLPSPSVPRSKK